MLHGHHRMMNPHHRADLVYPVAAGIDHDFCVDIALFGMNRPAVVLVLRQPNHRRVAVDLGPGLAGTSGEAAPGRCHRQADPTTLRSDCR